MAQYVSDVTALSSKGQIVLPKAIRDYLKLDTGTKLMVFSDGDCILIKPIAKPDLSEFRDLMDAAETWAARVGMTEDDIADAIKTVRAGRKK